MEPQVKLTKEQNHLIHYALARLARFSLQEVSLRLDQQNDDYLQYLWTAIFCLYHCFYSSDYQCLEKKLLDARAFEKKAQGSVDLIDEKLPEKEKIERRKRLTERSKTRADLESELQKKFSHATDHAFDQFLQSPQYKKLRNEHNQLPGTNDLKKNQQVVNTCRNLLMHPRKLRNEQAPEIPIKELHDLAVVIVWHEVERARSLKQIIPDYDAEIHNVPFGFKNISINEIMANFPERKIPLFGNHTKLIEEIPPKDDYSRGALIMEFMLALLEEMKESNSDIERLSLQMVYFNVTFEFGRLFLTPSNPMDFDKSAKPNLNDELKKNILDKVNIWAKIELGRFQAYGHLGSHISLFMSEGRVAGDEYVNLTTKEIYDHIKFVELLLQAFQELGKSENT